MTVLTTLADVKAWLQIPSSVTKDDALLTRLIAAASEAIESYCNISFSVQAYSHVVNGHGGDQIVPSKSPIVAVSQVQVDWRDVPASPGSGLPGYIFDETTITLFGYAFTRAKANVKLAYTAGYQTVPADIAQACVETVGLRYKELDRIGMVSKQLAGEVITFSQRDFSNATTTVLNNRRNVVPV